MKKYRFRLEAVLRVRRIEEERAQGVLLAAYQALREADAELERRLDHYRTVTAPDGSVPQHAFIAARSRQDGAASAVVAAGTARLAAEAEVERARQEWTEAAARVKALERLDDRRREEHALEALRQETIVLDEVASATRLAGSRA